MPAPEGDNTDLEQNPDKTEENKLEEDTAEDADDSDSDYIY